ncbi:MAG: 1,4-alpha-glucan-branching enzyme [Bacteroidetes bacterium HGW-Bacteroidetes-1]|jgi:1,4-alpha-glucan branching enzyme|nr:MAG: 1,4-alpha-glucan-branching enzyme [Bacteroidetes bacterium HGW-Bacteroidetes-1]
MKTKKLSLVENDAWLEPVNQAVNERYERYLSRLQHIDTFYGSLHAFASGDNLFGLNYDKGRKGWWYREWAPAAEQLYLMGDFNGWNRNNHPLTNNGRGIWEIFLDDKTYKKIFVHGSLLKVIVHSDLGETEHIPVYMKRVVQDETTKDFSGQLWQPAKPYIFKHTSPKLYKVEPLLIYETHVGMAQEREGLGTYNEFRKDVLPKIVKAGYNAIQLMAIAEHPYYGSFGYHVSSFFAPSSRFGTPEELKALVDEAHGLGLQVIMDIVHSHTVKNTREGLNLFDGTDYQYTHPGSRGEHPQWDSKLFNYGKDEVLQLLLSNLRYWLEDFQFDGFRFDGVTSMIYFHHGNGVTFDDPHKYFTDGVEFDAITYLQLANHLIHTINPHSISIAEEVSGMPGLCKPIDEGGIGFDYRLGMGLPDFWIKLLKDQSDDVWDIQEMYHTMTNRLFDIKTIAYAESHDQAMVGDKTIAFRLMDKDMYEFMSKETNNLVIDRGIALHKMIRLFTLTLGGEAWLNFMGNEFGHPEWIDFPREGNGWSYRHARRQWSLAEKKYLKYHWLSDFDKAMVSFAKRTHIMTSQPPWLLSADVENKTIVFERKNLIFVFNWHPSNAIPDYEIPLKETGDYRVVLNTDDKAFGGFDRVDNTLNYPSYIREDKVFMKIYNVNRAALVLEKVME